MMKRWFGFLGSWALLVLALGVLSMSVAGEVVNLREGKRYDRYDQIDRFLVDQRKNAATRLASEEAASTASVSTLRHSVESMEQKTEQLRDTDQTIVVSTLENKLWVKRGGQTVFQCVVSTGKGTTMINNGRTMVFDTPIGKFHIKSKEEHPVWVPPDWHYVEEARKKGLRVVHLNRGESIDAGNGEASSASEGVWSWMDNGAKLKIVGNDVVEESGGVSRPLPPGTMIRAGDAMIIPPVGTNQRKFDKVLGGYRLNLGDGYALHGTQAVDQLGRSVSHGCVRVGEQDLIYLYSISNVGDEVLIY